jgi:CHAD domain-containing protein/CYTH domain-containing protein
VTRRELPSDFLDLPVERATRIVGLSLLRGAADARARLLDPDDRDALHDFRVALRRLRSWIRAYRPQLDASVSGKTRRRLKSLTQAAGVARDLEVHLAWLGEQEDSLNEEQRPGAAYFHQELEGCKRDADETLRAEVAHDFARVAKALEEGLSNYAVTAPVDESPRLLPMSQVSAEAIRCGAHAFADRLLRVKSAEDRAAAHQARIEGKRLRYLLEPIAPQLVGASAVVKRLKRAQDVLGELHDASVLLQNVIVEAESCALGDPKRPGLVALAGRLHEAEATAYGVLARNWLDDHARGVIDAIYAAARDLAARPSADHASTGVEIERKYLLRSLPEYARDWPVRFIEQGYVPGDRLTERVRRVREGGVVRRYRTVKVGTGLVRNEIEEETTPQVFNALWRLTKGRRLVKRRYVVAGGDHRWEIDEFKDRELVLAEVELPAADAPVEPPDWLAPHIVREVTGEADYSNAHLAR